MRSYMLPLSVKIPSSKATYSYFRDRTEEERIDEMKNEFI